MVRVYVSIGSNIDREANIRSALAHLRRCFGAVATSTVYESEPVGLEGDNFYNLVVGFTTDRPPRELAAQLRDIETRHSRSRGDERYVSRTLDLDLLLYADAVIHDADLVIPREEVTACAYVLRPLAEIAGAERHPVSGERFDELWARFDQSSQAVWPVEMALDGA